MPAEKKGAKMKTKRQPVDCCNNLSSKIPSTVQHVKKKKKIQQHQSCSEALLACSNPVCMRRKSRSLHSQAFSCLSRSDPSRSQGPSLRTWAWSSDTRCSASCTKVAKCTARPSRLTTRKRMRETAREKEERQCMHIVLKEEFQYP